MVTPTGESISPPPLIGRGTLHGIKSRGSQQKGGLKAGCPHVCVRKAGSMSRLFRCAWGGQPVRKSDSFGFRPPFYRGLKGVGLMKSNLEQ